MQIQNILNSIWPVHCTLCHLYSDHSKYLCDDCRRTLAVCTSSCVQCGLIITGDDHNDICGACIASKPPFYRTIALFDYVAPISTLITQYKFHGNLPVATWLAAEWIYFLEKTKTQLPELIIPVPLHHARLKERGFNQSYLIAKPIGKHFGIPVDIRTCIRLKNTEAQSHLTAEKRKGNVKNAFALSHALSAKHIAILDDVMTTGSTVREISHLLKKSGVDRVDVWCCARAQ